MTSSDPPPRYALLRVGALFVASLAMLFALTGTVAQAGLLAWAVAVMALITFGATYHLKL